MRKCDLTALYFDILFVFYVVVKLIFLMWNYKRKMLFFDYVSYKNIFIIHYFDTLKTKGAKSISWNLGDTKEQLQLWVLFQNSYYTN